MRYVVFNKTIFNKLKIILDNCIYINKYLYCFLKKDNDILLGWGYKKSGLSVKKIAKKYNKKHYIIEDGFIKTIYNSKEQYSLIFDKKGIYYDIENSDLKDILLNIKNENLDKEKIKKLMSLYIFKEMTKYNHKKNSYDKITLYSKYNLDINKEISIIIDQVDGDMSLKYSNNEKSADEILLEIIEQNKNKQIILKIHPDIKEKNKKSFFYNKKTFDIIKNNNIIVISEEINSINILKIVTNVYTITSQVGLEAIFLGKNVTCYGNAFYSGLGLSNDLVTNKYTTLNKEELFYAIMIKYSKYYDYDIEVTLEHILNLK